MLTTLASRLTYTTSAKPLNSGLTLHDINNHFTFYKAGGTREVFISTLYPGLVLKRIYATCAWEAESARSDQEQELRSWTTMVKAGHSDMVPTHDAAFLAGELILIVERIEFTPESQYLSEQDPRILLASQFTSDLRPPHNCGLTTEGRFVVRDAGAEPGSAY